MFPATKLSAVIPGYRGLVISTLDTRTSTLERRGLRATFTLDARATSTLDLRLLYTLDTRANFHARQTKILLDKQNCNKQATR